MSHDVPFGEVTPGFVTVAPSNLLVTSGAVQPLDPRGLEVDVGGMRGVVIDDTSSAVELAFRYRGTSRTLAPLASGELRRQIGLKLRAADSCNLVYVMWHIEPTPGIYVSVKWNPGMTTHAECAELGYITAIPRTSVAPAPLADGPHTLTASLDGQTLHVVADGVLVWEGDLPPEGSLFDGPVGVRSDNGTFDFELRVPASG